MWLLLVFPVLVIGAISLAGVMRKPPAFGGADPQGLRTVVVWRDPPEVAADIASDPHEQLRQLIGKLAERKFIFSSSIDRPTDPDYAGPRARVDVSERRFDLRARPWRSGGWLLWIDEQRTAPVDSDDLRQLLTGLYRTLEARQVEGMSWHRREHFQGNDDKPSPGPFYNE